MLMCFMEEGAHKGKSAQSQNSPSAAVGGKTDRLTRLPRASWPLGLFEDQEEEDTAKEEGTQGHQVPGAAGSPQGSQ